MSSPAYHPTVIKYLWDNLPLGKAVFRCGRDLIVIPCGSKACH